MGRALRYTYKLLRAWRDEGIKGAFRAGVDRIILKGEAQDHDYSRPLWTVLDVLFVNGCPPEQLPHPYRYRVQHQMEQLRACGYSVGELFYEQCSEKTALLGQTLVFYRCPHTEQVEAAIRQAKKLNRRVVFDIDDLVFDRKYTDTIPTVQAMGPEERALYDEGVNRYGRTMDLCEAGTTTTPAMRREMAKRLPEVYVNRNCASEKMVKLSEAAWRKAKETRQDLLAAAGSGREDSGAGMTGARDVRAVLNAEGDGKAVNGADAAIETIVVMGYFSGTITHNADFRLIQPAVTRVMDENPEVRLLLMGKLDLPAEMEKYRERIIQKPFVDWTALPEIIAGVDINLAPLETSIFNEAKSENKWVEAALVKVATVASRTGAFQEMIRDGETGFLASDDEWYQVLTRVIRDGEGRRRVAEAAYEECKARCVTTANAGHVRQIYEKLRRPHAAFVLPSSEISGGIMVALRHACFLQDEGWNVDLIMPDLKWPVWTEFGHSFACISYKDGACVNESWYDLMVATMWTTVEVIQKYPRVGRKAYLVQNYETDFYPWDDPQRLDCESTYRLRSGWRYLTISRWCAGWLKEKYGQHAGLMRNGLVTESFRPVERDWSGRKIRVLIEGDSAVEYKNVDESFRIAGRLDPEKYEIWYMSYNASPKEGYRVDRFLHAVPYEKVPEVYGQCDILLKSSWLESFSYPPLEMMATGGWAVVAPNGGNAEYLRDGENCLLYPLGDEEAAMEAIRRISEDSDLRQKLRDGGIRTAAERDWRMVRPEIVAQYKAAAFPEDGRGLAAGAEGEEMNPGAEAGERGAREAALPVEKQEKDRAAKN